MKTSTIMTVFLATLFMVTTAFAVTVKTEKTEEIFEETPLLKSSTLEISEKQKTQLTKVSHGLRKKAVFGLVPVRVYVLQLLAAQPLRIVKTEDDVLKSLKTAGPVQLHITFLRNLPGAKITEAFKEGLESNKVNVKKLTPELEQVLAEVSSISEFKKGDTFSIVVDWKDSQAHIHVQHPDGNVKTISGNYEFAEQFLSIWFGKPSDGKLKDLKKDLIK